ncbi:UNVERIFIED_CONTAM: hypothetical protein H355_008667 [Colinus virginianus]|nr:hypothetical protein H355_008667 [Colinus virginianus]
MCLRWTVTSMLTPEEVQGVAEKGVYIHGLSLEGAAWEDGKGGNEGNITEARPKELFCSLPVINVYATRTNEFTWAQMYACPVYITAHRGPSYVCTANLRMDVDDKQDRWILAGVAMLMAEE